MNQTFRLKCSYLRKMLRLLLDNGSGATICYYSLLIINWNRPNAISLSKRWAQQWLAVSVYSTTSFWRTALERNFVFAAGNSRPALLDLSGILLFQTCSTCLYIFIVRSLRDVRVLYWAHLLFEATLHSSHSRLYNANCRRSFKPTTRKLCQAWGDVRKILAARERSHITSPLLLTYHDRHNHSMNYYQFLKFIRMLPLYQLTPEPF